MARPTRTPYAAPEHRTIELDGAEWVIVRRSDFDALLARAGAAPEVRDEAAAFGGLAVGREPLGDRLRRRREEVGLTQTELARRAAIRVETLNRIERGHTTSPDFATLRALHAAIEAARAPAGRGRRRKRA